VFVLGRPEELFRSSAMPSADVLENAKIAERL
jgi:hypothetical protein